MELEDIIRKLKIKIIEIIKIAAIEISKQYSDEQICSFALYTNGNADTISFAVNTKSYLEYVLKKYPKAQLYYTYDILDWHYQDIGAKKECIQLSDMLYFYISGRKGIVECLNFQSEFYKLCNECLYELKKQNFFEDIFKKQILLIFAILEYNWNLYWKLGEQLKWIRLLNNEEIANNYKKLYLASQEVDEEFIKMILTRPGMFLDTIRLDYFEQFLRGWYMSYYSRNPKLCWNSNYDLQIWCFQKQGAALKGAVSLTGWSLFKRCFGIKEHALNLFKKYYEELIHHYTDKKEDTIGYLIAESSRFLKDKEENRKTLEIFSYTIVEMIKDMFPIIDDKLVIYLYADDYYEQVRFVYQDSKKVWKDSLIFYEQERYKKKLIQLHAYIYYYLPEEFENYIITLKNSNNKIEIQTQKCKPITIPYKYKIDNKQYKGLTYINAVDILEEQLLENQFQSWKNKQI